MSEALPNDHVAKRRVVHTIPGLDKIRIVRDREFATGASGVLTMDLYYPDGAANDSLQAAAILVTGYSDPGAQRFIGCRFKEMGAFVSWAELIAASGIVAITYSNHTPDDVDRAIEHVVRNAAALGLDAERLAVWACSGHGPTALATLIRQQGRLRCAALVCPYTFDRAEATHVADAAAQFRFAAPAGRTAADLPAHVPLFVARAGRDQMPGLNHALDAFVADALARNLPISLVNHATGPHSFDVFDDSSGSHTAIDAALRFLQRHLSAV